MRMFVCIHLLTAVLVDIWIGPFWKGCVGKRLNEIVNFGWFASVHLLSKSETGSSFCVAYSSGWCFLLGCYAWYNMLIHVVSMCRLPSNDAVTVKRPMDPSCMRRDKVCMRGLAAVLTHLQSSILQGASAIQLLRSTFFLFGQLTLDSLFTNWISHSA